MRLKELRKANKYNQQTVAEILNTSQAVYSRYESGEREPSIDQLVKLADFYKVTLDELVGRKPMDVVTVFAEPPPKPEGFADVVIAAGPKPKATPDSLEKQIRSIMLDELKKRGL